MKKPKAPGLTAEERNLQRDQRERLAEQENEKRRRVALMGGGGRRSLLAGGELGVR
jgi:hypothetical protein